MHSVQLLYSVITVLQARITICTWRIKPIMCDFNETGLVHRLGVTLFIVWDSEAVCSDGFVFLVSV